MALAVDVIRARRRGREMYAREEDTNGHAGGNPGLGQPRRYRLLREPTLATCRRFSSNKAKGGSLFGALQLEWARAYQEPPDSLKESALARSTLNLGERGSN